MSMISRLSVPLRPRGLHFVLPLLVLLLVALPGLSRAADRARIEAFLNVTGFDVALDSIAFSAASAPQMLGMAPDAFGKDWERVTGEVFDTGVMRGIALDILEQTLDDGDLNHAVEFYASDLGQRLVEAENASHMIEDDSAKTAEGEAIIAGLVESGSERLELFKRMNRAIDSTGSSLRAIQEIQFRFLMAASAAGIVDLRMDTDELRGVLRQQESEMRIVLQRSALAGAAYTYRDFGEDDLLAYAEALETPQMARVYELLNAVQYEIMANRFEVLAGEMANLHPGQDI